MEDPDHPGSPDWHKRRRRPVTAARFAPAMNRPSVLGTGALRDTTLPALIRLLAALASASCRRPGARAPRSPHPRSTQFTLDNGLQVVVVIPDHRTPVVTHMLWYRVGAADEPTGKSGIAHFLEHLMFKGTAKNPAGRFSQQLAAIGGQENAFTATTTPATSSASRASISATMMEFEADRMTGLVLSEDIIAAERNVILEERNQRIDNDPSRASVASRCRRRNTSTIPITGRASAGATRWRRSTARTRSPSTSAYYQPDNAVLIVAGDVTAEEVKALAEKTYGKIEQRTADRRRASPAGAAADRRAAPDLCGFARHPAEPAAQLPCPVLHHRAGRTRATRSTCSPMCSAAARTAGSIARW